VKPRSALLFFACVLSAGSRVAAQAAPSHSQQREKQRPKVFFPMAQQPQMEMHHHGQIPQVMPQFPHLGDSQRVAPGPVYQLAELERMAEVNNPTLQQSQRAVEAARGQKLQVGLLPNPTVGYRGDEIRGGSFNGGEQGLYVEQPIILGGKLALNRKIGAAAEKVSQVEVEEQRQRINNGVRMAFYHVLGAQERLSLQRDIVAIAQTNVRAVHQLGQLGQADETEILEAEAEEQRMEVAAGIAEHALRREWAILTSVVGVPSLPHGSVAGRIDSDLPDLDRPKLLTSLLADSPELRAARARVEQAEAALKRATHEPIPDLTVHGGFQQNYESLGNPLKQQAGLQGFAEVGVQLHLWDRNQGGIASERAGVEAAREEVTRVELSLRNRFAAHEEDFASARLTADKYHDEILPRLERAYKLMTEQYGLMNASFIRVLSLQRILYENESAYLDTLERTWTSSIALNGFLLEGALDAPNATPREGYLTTTGQQPLNPWAMPPMTTSTPFAK